MADIAMKRTRLFLKKRVFDDGDVEVVDTGWELVSLPETGQYLAPIDFLGNLTNYDSEKEYTGLDIMDSPFLLSAGGKGGTGGSVTIPVGT